MKNFLVNKSLPETFEDISTLGFDWENDSLDNSQVTKQDVSIGDLDEDDIEADQRQYFKDNELIIDGFKCPDEFIKILSPMEFEEMVNLFTQFDANKSGTIDKHEMKKILYFLGLDASIEKAESLMQIIDIDKSGEIDFEEFCNFIVMIKRGDERLSGFNVLLDKLNSTPLGELQRRATNRDLKINFKLIEVRAATLTNPTMYLMELHLSGIWYKIEEGEAIGKFEVRKFQGLGTTTKEAKYNAASQAIINLGNAMPGMKYKEGEFPDEWLEWADDNLLRGVDPGKIVHILASKGFHPHKNYQLMHRLLAWSSFEKFIHQNPDIDFNDPYLELPEEFFIWVNDEANKGIDGKVISDLLMDRCIDIQAQDPHFAQKLRNNELGSLLEKDGQPASLMDFWHACKSGYIDEVLIYCKCEIDVNEEKFDRYTSLRMTPLMYAAMGGHSEIIKILIQYGARVNDIDNMGRTALHIAANKGYKDACTVLVDNKANIFDGDFQGNSPLHFAALNNHIDTVNYLASKGQDLTRLVVSNAVKPKSDKTFEQLVEDVFNKLPEVKLSKADTIRFEKGWLSEGALMFRRLMDENVRYMVARSCDEIMEDVLSRFDPRPESGIYVSSESTDQKFIKTIPSPNELQILMKYTFRQAAIDNINKWHRTALHLACDFNKTNSHKDLILSLIDFHGCNVNLKDIHGRKPIDLLIKDKIIPDMPSATQVREEMLLEKRQNRLDELFDYFLKFDEQQHRDRQRQILNDCTKRQYNISTKLWNVMLKASIFKKKYGDKWEMYEDPDCRNYFYTKIPDSAIPEENEIFSWTIPSEAKALFDRTNAIFYLKEIGSDLLRKYGEWTVYKCKRTEIEFYYHTKREDIIFSPPDELKWPQILKKSTKTKEKLGFANEWEVYLDKYQNRFYKNRLTREFEYDKPIDAIVLTPSDRLCTAYQVLLLLKIFPNIF